MPKYLTYAQRLGTLVVKDIRMLFAMTERCDTLVALGQRSALQQSGHKSMCRNHGI